MNLYNMRNRFYSPTLGRFLQPDPIGQSADEYNIYRYCGNTPVNGIDATGTSWSSNVYSFGKGVVSGAITAWFIVGGAVVLVAIAPEAAAFVTGTLAIAGIAGAVYTGFSAYVNFQSGNSDAGWFDIGSFVGALAVGAATGSTLATSLDPDGSPTGGLFNWNLRWIPDWDQSFAQNWNAGMTTGPDIAGTIGSSTTYASGLDSASNDLLNYTDPSPSPGYDDGYDFNGYLAPVQYSAPYAAGFDSEGYPIPSPATDGGPYTPPSSAGPNCAAGWEGDGGPNWLEEMTPACNR